MTQLQTIGGFTAEDLQTMKHTLATGTNDSQFNLFIRTAVASGLNPFLNHIYCIVYGGKMSIQVSVEGIVFLAKRVEGYQGIDTQLVHENDEFEAYINDEGRWVIGEHRIKFPRGKVIACYSIAYREGFKPFTVFIEVDEVQHHLTGTNAGNWKKYFNDFFKKTATKRAAKGQFGIEISEDETPAGAADVPAYEPQRKDITAEADEVAAAVKEARQSDPQPAPGDEMKKTRAQMKAKFTALGITTKEGMEAFIADNAKIKGAEPTLAEMKGLLKIMDMQIEENKAAANNDDLLE